MISVYLCRGKVKNRCLVKWTKPKNFMIMAVLFISEGALEFGFWCSICIVQMEKDRLTAGSEAFSFSLMVYISLCLVVLPIYLFIVGRKLHKAFKEKDEEMLERYSPIFEGKRFSDPWAIQYVVVFLLRRYSLISLIVFERYLTTVQVLGYLTLSTLMLAYILHARPYDTPLYNKVELFNETCVYITGWFIFL